MTRTALACLLAVIALVAACVAITTSADGADGAASRGRPGVATARLPSATVDSASPESAAVAVARDSGDSRHSSLRIFGAALAALVALVALAARRGIRPQVRATRATTARFAARRRGPPLLPTC